MEQRTLAGTALTVSRLCLGTMTFGSQVDRYTAASMIDCCLDHGINFIDTANVYNNGGSEAILGEVLGGRRDQVILASKVGIPVGDQPHEVGLSTGTIMYQIEQSLSRLRTEALDLYYLHQPDYLTPLEETVAALDALVRQGKVREVGASNHAAWQVCRLRCIAEVSGLHRVSVMQPMYNLLARGIETEFLPMCRALGLPTVVYNPLAGGLLTGKHQARQAPQAGTRFDGNASYQNRYWHNANFEAIERLNEAARHEGISLVSLALVWLLHHTPADCIILGASSLSQLQDNLQAASRGPLADDTLAVCEQVWPLVRGISPAYHR